MVNPNQIIIVESFGPRFIRIVEELSRVELRNKEHYTILDFVSLVRDRIKPGEKQLLVLSPEARTTDWVGDFVREMKERNAKLTVYIFDREISSETLCDLFVPRGETLHENFEDVVSEVLLFRVELEGGDQHGVTGS